MQRISIHALGVAAAALVMACGGHDATEKQLAELRAELVKVRAEGAVLSERLDAIERSRAAATAAPPRPVEPDRPSLDIVRLTPEASQRTAPAGAKAPMEASPEDPDDPPAVLRTTRGGEVILDDRRSGSRVRGSGSRPAPPRRHRP